VDRFPGTTSQATVILRPFRYGRLEAENDVLVELHADVTASRRRSITAI